MSDIKRKAEEEMEGGFRKKWDSDVRIARKKDETRQKKSKPSKFVSPEEEATCVSSPGPPAVSLTTTNQVLSAYLFF